jgi:hypothetical protein
VDEDSTRQKRSLIKSFGDRSFGVIAMDELQQRVQEECADGPVAELVGIEGGVVSGVFKPRII